MKPSHLISFLAGALIALGVTTIGQSQAQTPANHVYQLRMYHLNPGKMQATQDRFRNHVISIWNRHDMHAIGYWTPADPPDGDKPSNQNMIVYILQHSSREAGVKNWAAFNADPEWVKAKADSEVNGKLVDHVDDIYLNPTDFSPLK